MIQLSGKEEWFGGCFCQPFAAGLGIDTALPGARGPGASLPSLILTFGCVFFWLRSPPGTETMMTRRQRALGEPPGPPAGDTHRTVGTTAVSKVGTEPSRFLSWQDVTDALGDRFSLSDVAMCSGTRAGFVLLKVYLLFFWHSSFFFFHLLLVKRLASLFLQPCQQAHVRATYVPNLQCA